MFHFYPARAAIRSGRQLEGSPVVDNVGYVVVVLRKTPAERDMPEWVQVNLTGVIEYDAEGVFGVGRQAFFLTETSDDEWSTVFRDSSFWKGKGYVRVSSIEENSAVVDIYQDEFTRVSSVRLREGETSGDIYLGGYYCATGMNIRLDSIDYPRDTALLRVNDEKIWVGDGSRILDGKCTVRKVEIGELGGGRVLVNCRGVSQFDLIVSPPEVEFEVDGVSKNVSINGVLKREGGYNYFLTSIVKAPREEAYYAVVIRSLEDERTFANKGVSGIVTRLAENYLRSPRALMALRTLSEFGLFTFDAGLWGLSFEGYLRENVHKRLSLIHI